MTRWRSVARLGFVLVVSVPVGYGIDERADFRLVGSFFRVPVG